MLQTEQAFLAGAKAADALLPPGRNPHDDFDAGAAWTVGYHLRKGYAPHLSRLINEHRRLAGLDAHRCAALLRTLPGRQAHG